MFNPYGDPFPSQYYPPMRCPPPAFQPILIPERFLPELNQMQMTRPPFQTSAAQGSLQNAFEEPMPKRRREVETVDLCSEEESPFLTEAPVAKVCQLCRMFVSDLSVKFSGRLEMEKHARIHSEQTGRLLEDCMRMCFEEGPSTERPSDTRESGQMTQNSQQDLISEAENQPTLPNWTAPKMVFNEVPPRGKSAATDGKTTEKNAFDSAEHGKSKDSRQLPCSSTPIPAKTPGTKDFMDELELPSYGDFLKNLTASENETPKAASQSKAAKPPPKEKLLPLVSSPVTSEFNGSTRYRELLKEAMATAKKCRIPQCTVSTSLFQSASALERHATFHFSIPTVFCPKCSREMKPSEVSGHDPAHRKFLKCLRQKNEEKLFSALDSCFGPLKSLLRQREPTPPRFDSSLKPSQDPLDISEPLNEEDEKREKPKFLGVIEEIKKIFPVKCQYKNCRKATLRGFSELPHAAVHFPGLKSSECRVCMIPLSYGYGNRHKAIKHPGVKEDIIKDIRHRQDERWVEALRTCFLSKKSK